jgi:hypothetical protein
MIYMPLDSLESEPHNNVSSAQNLASLATGMS